MWEAWLHLRAPLGGAAGAWFGRGTPSGVGVLPDRKLRHSQHVIGCLLTVVVEITKYDIRITFTLSYFGFVRFGLLFYGDFSFRCDELMFGLFVPKDNEFRSLTAGFGLVDKL